MAYAPAAHLAPDGAEAGIRGQREIAPGPMNAEEKVLQSDPLRDESPGVPYQPAPRRKSTDVACVTRKRDGGCDRR